MSWLWEDSSLSLLEGHPAGESASGEKFPPDLKSLFREVGWGWGGEGRGPLSPGIYAVCTRPFSPPLLWGLIVIVGAPCFKKSGRVVCAWLSL